MKVKNSPQMEILKAVSHERQQNKFCYLIEQSAATHERFWDMLADSEPSYERFLYLGFAIRSINSRIHSIWKNLKRSGMRLSFKLMAIYEAYCESILQDNVRSTKMKSMLAAVGVRSEGDLLMKHAENGCSVIAVSATVLTVGKITSTNSAFCELSGYSRKELVNFPLEKIIPHIYRETHYNAFSHANFLLQLEQIIDFEQKAVFIVNKAGYLMPVIVRIVAPPNLGNGYCYFAKIIKDKSNNDFHTLHVLADPQKNIFALSSSMISNNIFRFLCSVRCINRDFKHY